MERTTVQQSTREHAYRFRAMWFERVAPAVVWCLPHWLVYWCLIRAWANATTGPYSDRDAVTVTMNEAVTRWERRTGGDGAFRDTAANLAAFVDSGLDRGIGRPPAMRTSRFLGVIESMRHADIEAQYGIRPGELCSECNVPIMADQITDALSPAVTFGGGAYHGECAPDEAFDGVPEDSAQIAVDRDRRERGD